MIRVVIIDDHPIARHGMRHLIGGRPGFDVVADAGSPEEGLRVLADNPCDVIVTDLLMPSRVEPDGIYFVKKLCALHPTAGIAVMTACTSHSLLSALTRTTWVTVVDKGALEAELLQAVDATSRRERYLSRGVMRNLEQASRPRKRADGGELSPREVEVLRLLQKGMSNRHIAELFGTSQKTISTQKQAAMRKLDAYSTAGLLAAAVRIGIVDHP